MNNQTKSDVERLRKMAIVTGPIDGQCSSDWFEAKKETSALLRRAADAMEEVAKLQSAGGDVTQEDIDSLLTEAATYDLNATDPEILDTAKKMCVDEAAKLWRIVNAVVERAKIKTAMEVFEVTMKAVYEERDRLKAENIEWLTCYRALEGNSDDAATERKAWARMHELATGNGYCDTPEPMVKKLAGERDRLREAVKVLREGIIHVLAFERIPGLYHGGETFCGLVDRVKASLKSDIAKADTILAGKEGGRDDA